MIRPVARNLPHDPIEAAAWWSARRRLGLLSEREEEAFQRWLRQPGHAAAWDAVDTQVELSGDFASSPDIRAMRDAALVVRPSRRNRWSWMLPSVAVAGAVLWLEMGDSLSIWSTPAQQVAAQSYTVPVGQRREIVLSDGSHVLMDTDTGLDVAFTAGHRDIRLLRGQALFRVARDPGRPFVVAAGDRKVTAVGTEFDVRLDPTGAVRVLLVHGRVTVDSARPGGLARFIPALAREALVPGQILTAAPSETPTIGDADLKIGTSWSQGQLIFRDDPLSQVVAEMNRYASTPITIGDPRLGRIPISGVFATDRADGFADIIALAYPVSVERRPGRGIFLDWRDSRGAIKENSKTQ